MKAFERGDRYTISLPYIPIAQPCGRGLLAVDRSSPRSHIAVVERFGYYITRENGYDFPLTLGHESKSKAYLFLEDAGVTKVRPIGVAVFDFPADAYSIYRVGERWWFEWCWIHPYQRRKGLLSRYFPEFEAELGQFVIHGPYSAAMKSFLLKRGKCVECWGPITTQLRCAECTSKNWREPG